MPEHAVASREEWQLARDDLLAREKELTRRNDELARARRELPWVRVEKEYRFDTDEGVKTLAELFDGRSQLVVYHFMFGPAYAAGCAVCSSIADTLQGALPHVNARDVTLGCVSRAPLAQLQAYKRRMGWTFPWASSAESDFNFDFGMSHTPEEVQPMLGGDLGAVAQAAAACDTDPAEFLQEGPGLSAFALDDRVVYQTYQTTARGLEPMMAYYGVLDRTARGRHEDDPPEFWFRRKDEY
jgi:predicted dithiol-disulfide oxidoreductase (DUF899 family)